MSKVVDYTIFLLVTVMLAITGVFALVLGITSAEKKRSWLAAYVKSQYPDAFPVYHPETNASQSEIKNKLIFLVGWGGSKRKNMTKIIQYYNGAGFGVVSHTMPMTVSGYFRDYIEELVAEEINKHIPGDREHLFITHLFSNNGSWSFVGLLKRNLIPLPHMVIWDSSPSLRKSADFSLFSIVSGFTKVAVSTYLKKSVYYHPVLTPVFTVVLLIVVGLTRLIQRFQGNYHIVPNLSELISYQWESVPLIPSLFISSTGDKLVLASKVIEFMDVYFDRGAPVAFKVFGEDVPHTSAFYKYKTEYVEFLESFISKDYKIKLEAFKTKSLKS